ncbi:BatD family protein [Oceanicoccus sp. KOV_DT_Chl]|uniref:BatD family protein n=1 Tax=Oceanicoccus sp. KOV_DT_Chl TaxID=1904639 RepID=UPI000C7E5902|nr:BatD family protein [Oceanicoccus sp. KOV_DT_Chl]
MVTIRTFNAFVIFSLVLLCQPLLADPIAKIDRSVIAVDDTLSLTIRVDKAGSFASGPDLSPLENDFHILGNSQSSRHMIRNGQSESWTEWAITLMPKRQGQLVIPPLTIDGEKTQAIVINVQPSVPHSASNMQPIFLESEISADTVYVQQQLIFTLRIFQSIQLDNMNISEPEFDNAAIEKLAQNSFQRRIQNTPYRVHELRYAIFPQQSGELIIPELVFTANETIGRRSVFSLPGQGKAMRKMTQQHRVSVKQPPSNYKGQQWLPADSIKLVETWSSSPGNIRVGDSITRTLTINAEGLLGSQLPPFKFESIEGAKLYPDQGNTETTATDNGVIATRSDSVAIIPTREGKLQLPEVSLSWWDSKAQKTRIATIPASTLNVKPSLESATSSSTPLAVNHSQPASNITAPVVMHGDTHLWQTVSAVLASGWLLTLLLWWYMQRGNKPAIEIETRSSEPESEKKAFKHLTQVCRANDISKVRAAMVSWANQYWPEQSIQSLQDIIDTSGHASLSNVLMQLDNQLYGSNKGSSDWNGEGLLSVLKLVKEKDRSKTNTRETLPPLYKN